ncbi:11001_t:CDS:2 [Dentiscutata heterogama]|uniref:11001_t:CDS:1 n=1 Tax=Dentiscutata heterogama TaxID=1316150 RepID=A0ACA9NY74_9GLOM|nr:11001_t:CDS:2 [Dentiscutata heterogama]
MNNWAKAITNEQEVSTKDILPLTESHSPEIEHSSTQSERQSFGISQSLKYL